MTQFLFIAAIILIAMIKFWNASSKKEQSGGGTENFPFPWEEDNTMEDSREGSRQVLPQSGEAPYASSVPPQPTGQTMTQTTAQTTAQTIAQTMAQTMAQRNSESIIQPTVQPYTQSPTQSNTQLHHTSTNQTTAIETSTKTYNKAIESTENKELKFNLREAVIYSEILTPKFKDYEV
ncbi:MAG: hypothetical protein R3Y61_02885 [Rikenellaceae bacterium]